MGDYSLKSMEQLLAAVHGVNPQVWLQAASTWGSMATSINTTQADLDDAWSKTAIFHRNDIGGVGSPDSKAFVTFNASVASSKKTAAVWSTFAQDVGNRLTNTAGAVSNAWPVVEAAAQDYAVADNVYRLAMADGQRGTATLASNAMEQAHGTAVFVMNNLASVIEKTFEGITTLPTEKYDGPMTSTQTADQSGGGDPAALNGDEGGGAATTGDAGDDGGAGVNPATPVDSPTTPDETEVTDPVEEAGELIDVIGKGIDLIGKVPENLTKWLELAQSAQDLLGETDTTTPSVDTHNPITDGPVPDGAGIGLPTLAGGTALEPAFDQARIVQPGGTIGGGVGGLPSLGSLPGVGGIDSGTGKLGKLPGTTDRGIASASKGATTAAGGPGSAPSLAGQAAATSSSQQATSPMYPPPMGGGMGAAGNGGRGEIKSGAAPSRPGFSVPAEQTEAERLRRHGVQTDLQGRANGEQPATSGGPPLRKRKRDARVGKATDREVLDEELWRM
ncbi:hypothetical protein [Kribbella catacumbae]|uniref:hypothetical protein n=1 Tax=Kribbella catacumbae TaxID=460086 RepID=UPI00039D0924|nr:hypothetical protein [Kribbella catacumbae]